MFYVYAYIRNTDYNAAVAGTPYYIGKGKGRRYLQKHGKIPVPINVHCIVLLETNLTEIGAFALERRYIKWWGRKDLGTGVLLNRTDGGDGSSGRVVDPMTVERISKLNTGKVRSVLTRQNISNSLRGKKKSLEHVKRNSESHRGKTQSQITKDKRAKSNTGKKRSIETKNRISIANSNQSLETRNKRSASLLNHTVSDITRSKISASVKNIPKEKCLHCNKVASPSNISRWHNNNCKYKK